MEDFIIETEGRGMNQAQQRNLEHRVVQQLLLPSKDRMISMLIPNVIERNGRQDLTFHFLVNALLPTPQANTAARRTQTVFVMSSMSNGWTNEKSPNWDQNNPVTNANRKMFDLMNQKAPFNSMIVTGSISTEYVPANYDVSVTPLNQAAQELYLAYNAVVQSESKPSTRKEAQARLKAAMAAYRELKQKYIDNQKLVKSNVFYAGQNGIVLANSLVQGMDVPNSPTLNAENLWNNPKSKLTFAPYINSFTGPVYPTQEEQDRNHPVFTYGVQETQQSKRTFCRKGATVSSAGRQSEIRVDIYDNMMNMRDGQRTRSEVFEQNTRGDAPIIILAARLSVHPYSASNGTHSTILGSKFHVEVEQYMTGVQSANNTATFSTEGIEDFVAVAEGFDLGGETLDVVEPEFTPVAQEKAVEPATTAQQDEDDDDSPFA